MVVTSQINGHLTAHAGVLRAGNGGECSEGEGGVRVWISRPCPLRLDIDLSPNIPWVGRGWQFIIKMIRISFTKKWGSAEYFLCVFICLNLCSPSKQPQLGLNHAFSWSCWLSCLSNSLLTTQSSPLTTSGNTAEFPEVT